MELIKTLLESFGIDNPTIEQSDNMLIIEYDYFISEEEEEYFVGRIRHFPGTYNQLPESDFFDFSHHRKFQEAAIQLTFYIVVNLWTIRKSLKELERQNEGYLSHEEWLGAQEMSLRAERPDLFNDEIEEKKRQE